MKLQNCATLFALRSTARLAWGLAGRSRSLETLGERIEGAVDTYALRSRVNIAEVFAPFIAKRIAG